MAKQPRKNLPLLRFLSFCFAKKKEAKKKAIFDPIAAPPLKLRRHAVRWPKNSSTLLTSSIYRLHGAEILPILATILLLNRINFNSKSNYSIRIYDSLKAPS